MKRIGFLLIVFLALASCAALRPTVESGVYFVKGLILDPTKPVRLAHVQVTTSNYDYVRTTEVLEKAIKREFTEAGIQIVRTPSSLAADLRVHIVPPHPARLPLDVKRVAFFSLQTEPNTYLLIGVKIQDKTFGTVAVADHPHRWNIQAVARKIAAPFK
jgi:hypothetical protein